NMRSRGITRSSFDSVIDDGGRLHIERPGMVGIRRRPRTTARHLRDCSPDGWTAAAKVTNAIQFVLYAGDCGNETLKFRQRGDRARVVALRVTVRGPEVPQGLWKRG